MDYLETAKKNIQIGDLPPQCQEIAYITGLDAFIRLCECVGGSSIYIPTFREAARPYIYKKVRSSKGIMTKPQLAKAYGLSKSTVYNLLKDEGR